MTTAAPSGRSSTGLIPPHGGSLVDLIVPAEQREALKAGVDRVLECSHRNACDVELLMVGGFSPLLGFMHQEDYEAVVKGNRTTSGLLFGLPIIFDTADATIQVGERLLLTYQGQELAVLTVESRWEPDKVKEAKGCYGTTSLEHPAVRMIATERGRYYLGGALQGLELPQRVFPCRTPAQVRADLPHGEDVVAFQCRNPIHRAHYELFTRALHATNVSEGEWCWCIPPAVPPRKMTLPVRCASRLMSAWRRRWPIPESAGPTCPTPCTWPGLGRRCST